jgi:hypothetical protein
VTRWRLHISFTWDGKPWWQLRDIAKTDHANRTSWHVSASAAIASAARMTVYRETNWVQA